MKVTGPAGQQKMNCCGPNWPDCLRNARGPAGTYPMSSPAYTYTFIYFPKICSPIQHYSGSLDFVANPPYMIFIWSMFISSPILWVITSRVASLLPFYRPAACLEAHPAGVPGNCHLLASLSLRQESALDKVSKNLWQSYQRLHLVNNYTVCHSSCCLYLIDTQ